MWSSLPDSAVDDNGLGKFNPKLAGCKGSTKKDFSYT